MRQFRPVRGGQALPDPQLEEVRRSHAEAIAELQREAAGRVVLADVELPDATDVVLAHGLGRRAQFVAVSPPRGASSTGRIAEVRSSTYPRDRYLVLRADGHGATITVDVEVR